MKGTDWTPLLREEEPFDKVDMELEALSYLETLGIPRDEISDVRVDRIVSQSEDAEGNDVGPEETVGFMVSIARQLDGFPVDGSRARVTFNARGDLHKINLFWRSILSEPSDQKTIIDPVQLEQASREQIRLLSEGTDPSFFSGALAYFEDSYKSGQLFFSLKYIYYYGYDEGGARRGMISAHEE